mmetsp:Transcript_65053/g.155347  ORF Transcript_65053/g.155347 Transcript_65053/m.155347 type:complete len:241 (+) Transcript_65053:71-793(+)
MQPGPRLLGNLARELDFVTKYDKPPEDYEWFLIDAGWLKQWNRYVSKNGEHPGPISNDLLLDAEHEFKKPKQSLRVAVHYRGVCAMVWHYLWQRYGGGPKITVSGHVSDLHLAVVSEELPKMLSNPSQPRSPNHCRSPSNKLTPSPRAESGMLSKLMRSLAKLGNSKKKQSTSQVPVTSSSGACLTAVAAQPASDKVQCSQLISPKNSESTRGSDSDNGPGGDDDFLAIAIPSQKRAVTC